MKTNKVFLFLIFLAFILFPGLILASYPRCQYPQITPIEKMQPNGEYIIYVEQEGKWQEVGSLSYNRYFREKGIDIGRYITGDREVKIRLVQKGGGAAHIDSIFLGGRPPVEVNGVENGLKKLSQKDFDVIDAFDKNMQVVFRKNGKDKTLILTARVEAIEPLGQPLQFPRMNDCKNVDIEAKFYTYKIDSRKGKIKIDGVIDEAAYHWPFFREYHYPCTGHPSGYTYGWIWNDDKNLYVSIDATGDNTMDGDKDFAKVFVKTNKGVKEFKVSVPDTKWGIPGFTYTDRVQYQHKVYEFKIPLNEISNSDIRKNDKLFLAFSVYGTEGICCLPDNSCIYQVDPWCSDAGGVYHIEISSCDPNPCGPADIPTITQWGMIIFVVFAGLGAAFYMRRQARKNS